MIEILHKWRYYSLGQEQYKQCMQKMFFNNLHSLRQANIAITFLIFCFTLFHIVIEKDIYKASMYIVTVIIALLLAVFVNRPYKQYKQGKQVSNFYIYLLTTIYYANIIFFGIYISVWTNTGGLAVIFMIFLICALFLFITPPLYNLLLTLGAMTIFTLSTVLIKEPKNWIFDIAHVLIAGSVSLFFCWQITVFRLKSALNESKLEEENTIDELTKLKNRRDFTQTFQRRLSNYRSSDDLLCVAIMDIDFFKDYNDHYGHPQGDECLRAIGKLLNSLHDSMGVYAARVGGEEFALIWYEKDAAQIQTTVSKIQQMIIELNIPHEKSKVAAHITVSTGVFSLRCGMSSDIHALYHCADQALYAAKRGGRNRAVIHGT